MDLKRKVALLTGTRPGDRDFAQNFRRIGGGAQLAWRPAN
jgi:hypothetical protein